MSAGLKPSPLSDTIMLNSCTCTDIDVAFASIELRMSSIVAFLMEGISIWDLKTSVFSKDNFLIIYDDNNLWTPRPRNCGVLFQSKTVSGKTL